MFLHANVVRVKKEKTTTRRFLTKENPLNGRGKKGDSGKHL